MDHSRFVPSTSLRGVGSNQTAGSIPQPIDPISYYLETGDSSRLGSQYLGLDDSQEPSTNAGYKMGPKHTVSGTQHSNSHQAPRGHDLGPLSLQSQHRRGNAQRAVGYGNSSNHGSYNDSARHTLHNARPFPDGDQLPFNYDDLMNLNNFCGSSGIIESGLPQAHSEPMVSHNHFPHPTSLPPGQMYAHSYQAPYLFEAPVNEATVTDGGSSIPSAFSPVNSAPMDTYKPLHSGHTPRQGEIDGQIHGQAQNLQFWDDDPPSMVQVESYSSMNAAMGRVKGRAYPVPVIEGSQACNFGADSPWSEEYLDALLDGEAEFTDFDLEGDEEEDLSEEFEPSPPANPVPKSSKPPTRYGELRADSGQKQEYVFEWELEKYRCGYHPGNKMALACFTKPLSESARKQVDHPDKRRVRLLRSEWADICRGRNTPNKIAGRTSKFSAKRIAEGERNLLNSLNRKRRRLEFDHARNIWVDRA